MDQNLIQTYIKELDLIFRDYSSADALVEIKQLIKLENKFRKQLCSTKEGRGVYKDLVVNTLQNNKLLPMKVLFREKADQYKPVINPAVRGRKYAALYKLSINYNFCYYAVNNLAQKGIVDEKLNNILESIKTLRDSIIKRYLLVALNRAKVHNKKIGGIVDFEDLIQMANIGIISAVDKYVVSDESATFHQYVIGWITGNLILSSMQTLPVTLWPTAARKLLQIKRLTDKTPGISPQQISVIAEITEEEVSRLLNVSNYKSLDEDINKSSDDYGSLTLLDLLPAEDDESNGYAAIEQGDLTRKIAEGFKTLTIMEQKVLRLKGINFKDYL